MRVRHRGVRVVDVTAAVDYLVSPGAAYITGNVIDVNGGYRMQ